jgi:sporulation protein YlmC with PRC-barrel domain
MSNRYSIPTAIALSAMIATPVLAQMTSPSSPTMPSKTITSPMTPPTATDMRSTASQTYVTADQQVRVSKVIGSSVYNDQKQKIGSIDELLMNQNHDVTGVVLSVGGFLGIGSKLVKVPYDQLHFAGDSITMSGATKDQLVNLPSYSYTGAG